MFSVADKGLHARHCPDGGLHQGPVVDEGGEAGREGDDDVQSHSHGTWVYIPGQETKTAMRMTTMSSTTCSHCWTQ